MGGYASAVKSAVLEGKPSNLKVVNSFVALNDKLDLQYNETTSLSEPLPSSAMKFVRVRSSYCKGNNLAEADVKKTVWANSCYSKCKDTGLSGTPACAGYLAGCRCWSQNSSTFILISSRAKIPNYRQNI